MPAHEVYQVLVDIWSGGCNPQLRYALPILFSWEVIGLAFSTLGVYRRCHYAVIAEEAQENAFNERLNTAMAFEKKRDEERKKELMVEMKEKRGSESPTFESQEERDDRIQVEEKEQEDVREELTSVIRNENEQLQRERTRKASRVDFGPSFDLAYRSSTS
jgi:flagellar biosynthesis GTPase FlhF